MMQFDRSSTAYKSWFDKNDNWQTVLLSRMALSAMAIGDDEKALQILQDMDTSHVITYDTKAELYQKRKDWHSAIVSYQDIIDKCQLTPNSPRIVEAHISIAHMYLKLKDWKAALNSYHVHLIYNYNINRKNIH
jgi:tetratricopeptide (TPR) repeat protein